MSAPTKHRQAALARATAARVDDDDRFVTMEQLAQYGISHDRVTLNRLIAQGQFPRKVKLSARKTAWRLSDIRAWIASREVV